MTPADLVRCQDAIRLKYLTIRDGLYTPPRLANTDGDPLVFHTLKFRIESPEEAFDALAPLALLQSKEELLEEAKFGKDGKLESIEFDWSRKGNPRIPSWDNTILGNIKIAGRSLIAKVNSANRARRLRAEIERRLGASVTHQSTTAQTADEMLAKAPKRTKAQAKDGEEFEQALRRDPEAKRRLQEIIEKQAEDWVNHKVPALGGRTPLQAVRDPDGREIVESLLLNLNAMPLMAATRPEFAPTSTSSADS